MPETANPGKLIQHWPWLGAVLVLAASAGPVLYRLSRPAPEPAAERARDWHDLLLSLRADDYVLAETGQRELFAGAVQVQTASLVDCRLGVNLFVSLADGPCPDVATHTPDMCFVGHGYRMEAKPARLRQVQADYPDFFHATFMQQGPAGARIARVFWAWRAAGGWRTADNPRLQFASRGRLQKLYVIRYLDEVNEPVASDPAIRLLRVLEGRSTAGG
jgi:hypothetical protein